MQFFDKVKSVLDDLLPLVDLTRVEPPEVLIVSDSDDDYWFAITRQLVRINPGIRKASKHVKFFWC